MFSLNSEFLVVFHLMTMAGFFVQESTQFLAFMEAYAFLHLGLLKGLSMPGGGGRAKRFVKWNTHSTCQISMKQSALKS
jgi:hypothetical protein